MERIQIISVRDPVWSNEFHTSIDCVIRTSAWHTELPFTARADDPENHGSEVFLKCVAGEFGEIGAYQKPLASVETTNSESHLGWDSVWPEVRDFICEANAENARSSPRAIGLVWGSMLEKLLRDFLMDQLTKRGLSLSDVRRAPNAKRPEGRRFAETFFDFIECALQEGVIDRTLSVNLHAIRRIRNACAHEWRLNCGNPKVSDLNESFDVLTEAYFPNFALTDFERRMQMVYSGSCCCIMTQFAERMVASA
jgi:hypothetical protein